MTCLCRSYAFSTASTNYCLRKMKESDVRSHPFSRSSLFLLTPSMITRTEKKESRSFSTLFSPFPCWVQIGADENALLSDRTWMIEYGYRFSMVWVPSYRSFGTYLGDRFRGLLPSILNLNDSLEESCANQGKVSGVRSLLATAPELYSCESTPTLALVVTFSYFRRYAC